MLSHGVEVGSEWGVGWVALTVHTMWTPSGQYHVAYSSSSILEMLTSQPGHFFHPNKPEGRKFNILDSSYKKIL